MLDNRTAGVSIARKLQVVVFQKLDPTISINISITKNYKICFGKGKVISISII
jgi:hypothetical protein